MHQNPVSTVINNGHYTSFFPLYRGVRQRCPLSPYLFILTIEPLANKIRKETEIQGIILGDTECKISLYADDMTLLLNPSPGNIENCFEIIDEFSQISGLKLNKKKTEKLPLGIRTEIQGECKTIRLLGIKLNPDHKTQESQNFEPAIGKIKHITKLWNKRKLSLLGRIYILKSLGVSQLIHILSVLPTPCKEYLDEINKIFFAYIWKGGKNRIRRDTLIGPYDTGGLKAPDIFTLSQSLKFKWIQLYLSSQTILWKDWVKLNTPPLEMIHVFECNISPKDVKFIYFGPENSFWKDTINVWCNINYDSVIENRDQILNQIFHLNSSVRIQGSPFLKTNWYKAGAIYIKDLIDDDKKNFLKLDDFNAKFGLNCNFLDYYQTLQAIPKHWRRKIKLGKRPEDEVHIHLIHKLLPKTHKEIYDYLICLKCHPPFERYHSWLNDLQIRVQNIDAQDWIESYQSCFRLTVSTKLRSFEYQQRMRDLMCNKKLHSMKIKGSPHCFHCNGEIDSIMHMLWTCPIIQKLWIELQSWIKLICGFKIVLEPWYVILSLDKDDKECTPDVIWLILLVTKQYIYRCKCLETSASISGTIHHLKQIEAIEYNLSVEKGKIGHHFDKWSSFATFFRPDESWHIAEDAEYI